MGYKLVLLLDMCLKRLWQTVHFLCDQRQWIHHIYFYINLQDDSKVPSEPMSGCLVSMMLGALAGLQSIICDSPFLILSKVIDAKNMTLSGQAGLLLFSLAFIEPATLKDFLQCP